MDELERLISIFGDEVGRKIHPINDAEKLTNGNGAHGRQIEQPAKGP